jgi:hypothetical protein
MDKRMTLVEIAAAIGLAIIIVVVVSSYFETMTEADRAEMLIDGTSGLPQDR